MPITVIKSTVDGTVHGTDNGKRTGCGIRYTSGDNLRKYQQGEVLTDLIQAMKTLNCEKCRRVLSAKMIKEDRKAENRREKEEKKRIAEAIKRGELDSNGNPIIQEVTIDPSLLSDDVQVVDMPENEATSTTTEPIADSETVTTTEDSTSTMESATINTATIEEPTPEPVVAPKRENIVIPQATPLKRGFVPPSNGKPVPTLKFNNDPTPEEPTVAVQEVPAPEPKPVEPTPVQTTPEDDDFSKYIVNPKEIKSEEPVAPKKKPSEDISSILAELDALMSKPKTQPKTTTKQSKPVLDSFEDDDFSKYIVHPNTDTSNSVDTPIESTSQFEEVSAPVLEDISTPVEEEPVIEEVSAPVLEDISTPVEEEPVIEEVSTPVLEDISTPVEEEPVIEEVSAPVLEDISTPVEEEPIIEEVSAPVLEDISTPVEEEPVIEEVSAPVLEDISTPVEEEPVIEEVSTPVLEDMDEIDTITNVQESEPEKETEETITPIEEETTIDEEEEFEVPKLEDFIPTDTAKRILDYTEPKQETPIETVTTPQPTPVQPQVTPIQPQMNTPIQPQPMVQPTPVPQYYYNAYGEAIPITYNAQNQPVFMVPVNYDAQGQPRPVMMNPQPMPASYMQPTYMQPAQSPQPTYTAPTPQPTTPPVTPAPTRVVRADAPPLLSKPEENKPFDWSKFDTPKKTQTVFNTGEGKILDSFEEALNQLGVETNEEKSKEDEIVPEFEAYIPTKHNTTQLKQEPTKTAPVLSESERKKREKIDAQFRKQLEKRGLDNNRHQRHK